MKTIIQLSYDWVSQSSSESKQIPAEFYCETRDVFQSRLEVILPQLLKIISEDKAYFLYAITGEIGNNSFDHNIGKWKDMPGIFFAYDLENKIIALADRGQGVLATLKQVKPDLNNDVEALKMAFTKRISGRSPENRGNGLKFVNNTISQNNFHLNFFSGNGEIEINQEMNLKEKDKTINGCLAIITFA